MVDLAELLGIYRSYKKSKLCVAFGCEHDPRLVHNVHLNLHFILDLHRLKIRIDYITNFQWHLERPLRALQLVIPYFVILH